MAQIMIFSFLFWGGINYFFAKKRGRNPFNWFLVGGLFGVLGFLLLITRKSPQKIVIRTPQAKPLPHALWYYLEGKTPIGSISTQALRKAYLDDAIEDQTLVWNESMDNWARLDSLPIFEQLSTVLDNT